MKSTISLSRFWAVTAMAAVIALASCGKEEYSPTAGMSAPGILSGSSLDKRNGKGKSNGNEGEPLPDPFVTTYQLVQSDDWDPLFKFSISQSGRLMLLETDPAVTSWGTDYWGYWSDPFSYSDSKVNYIIGLTNTTYQFRTMPDNTIDVTKTLVVQPYPSGPPTTTISHPGVYTLAN